MQTDFQRDLQLLQLTDLHLFGTPDRRMLGMNTRDSFLGVLDLALQHKSPIDFILCTGDLVHDESAEGYQFLGEQLRATGIPFACIPGNHDDTRLIATHCQSTSQQTRIQIGQWQIILLNSQKPGCVEGHVDDTQLRRLQTELQAHPDLFSMICLHHPLVEINSQWIDTLRCDNGDQVLAAIASHRNVKLVCWGHAHQAYEQQRQGLQLLGTPSTCFQFKPNAQEFAIDLVPPGFRRFCLRQDGRFTSQVERASELPIGLNAATGGY